MNAEEIKKSNSIISSHFQRIYFVLTNNLINEFREYSKSLETNITKILSLINDRNDLTVKRDEVQEIVETH